MASATKKRTHNFHLPLPPDLYRRLRIEAERAGLPATALAREAIRIALRERRRSELRAAITRYAEATAGTSGDLDADLEAAAIERLLDEEAGR